MISQEDMNDRAIESLPSILAGSIGQRELHSLKDSKLSYNNASNVFNLNEIEDYLKRRSLLEPADSRNYRKASEIIQN